MKVIAAILFTLILASTVAAQVDPGRSRVAFSNFTYANNEADTSGAQAVAGASRLALLITSLDSTAADVYVQYMDNNTTWTTKFTDSLITTVNTGKEQEYVLKDSDSDVFDAFAFGVRVILAARATGNGVTSPTFKAQWVFRY